MNEEIELSFNGGYGRVGIIEVCTIDCDICGEMKRCIYIDGSEGEYAGGAVCLDCATKLLSE